MPLELNLETIRKLKEAIIVSTYTNSFINDPRPIMDATAPELLSIAIREYQTNVGFNIQVQNTLNAVLKVL